MNSHFEKKIFFIFIFLFLLNITNLYANSKCFLILENKTDFSTSLMSAMTTSIISQFVTEIEEVPISGIDAEKKVVFIK